MIHPKAVETPETKMFCKIQVLHGYLVYCGEKIASELRMAVT